MRRLRWIGSVAILLACCGMARGVRGGLSGSSLSVRASKSPTPDVQVLPSASFPASYLERLARLPKQRVLLVLVRHRDHRPVPYATVACPSAKRGSVTDSLGICCLTEMPSDTCRLKLSVFGYKDAYFTAIVRPGEYAGIEVVPRALYRADFVVSDTRHPVTVPEWVP